MHFPLHYHKWFLMFNFEHELLINSKLFILLKIKVQFNSKYGRLLQLSKIKCTKFQFIINLLPLFPHISFRHLHLINFGTFLNNKSFT